MFLYRKAWAIKVIDLQKEKKKRNEKFIARNLKPCWDAIFD